MITYTWTIDNMNISSQAINGHSGVVLTAQWRCFGIDSDTKTSSEIYRSCSFPQPSEENSFTSYSGLTQSQVLEWCWSNGIEKNVIEEQIGANIFATNNPPVIQSPLPWITPPGIE
jgi:hypothetical protein